MLYFNKNMESKDEGEELRKVLNIDGKTMRNCGRKEQKHHM